MKAINFGKDDADVFYKTLHQRVFTYLKNTRNGTRANLYFWFKCAFYYTGFAVSYAMILSPQNNSTGQLMIAYLLTGLFVLGIIFNVAHDAAHNTLFHNAKLNRFFYAISFPLLGNHPFVWRTYHLKSHHMYTNVEESDIDVIQNRWLRLHEHEPVKKFQRFQFLYAPFIYLLYTLNFVIFRDVIALFGKTDRTIEINVPLAAKFSYVLSKCFYFSSFLLLPWLIGDHAFGAILLAFLIMHFFMSLIIVLVLSCNHQVDLAHHLSHEEAQASGMSWVSLQLKSNLDYSASSRFFHFFVGGFNAHTIHHLFPTVCHVHYRKLVQIMRTTCAEYNVHYNETSYVNALASHFRFLKKMGNPEKR
ncbi:MAG TPA: fatty acid desaturase [Flavobacteriales bacterium]|nr:fatty acid desaturase [Flavobacteriales bacterium]